VLVSAVVTHHRIKQWKILFFFPYLIQKRFHRIFFFLIRESLGYFANFSEFLHMQINPRACMYKKKIDPLDYLLKKKTEFGICLYGCMCGGGGGLSNFSA